MIRVCKSSCPESLKVEICRTCNTNSYLKSLSCLLPVLLCDFINYFKLKDFCVLFFYDIWFIAVLFVFNNVQKLPNHVPELRICRNVHPHINFSPKSFPYKRKELFILISIFSCSLYPFPGKTFRRGKAASIDKSDLLHDWYVRLIKYYKYWNYSE
ncbi:hypothetical protein SDC9_169310 [bioreactor metagenome]|uniref:Uncharacterized protein n=1 Tax=bioreactor metagenome TaxID=1076179 RepID=A0A645G4Z0_9ZZZZ